MFWLDASRGHDAEIIRRMKNAGLIVLGKTNVPELGLLPVTEPELFGVVAGAPSFAERRLNGLE